MKYFRVKYGFGNIDFVSIDETELRKAIVAQVKGQVGIFNEGTVAGNNIISITPDVQRMMGYNPTYQLTGEDYESIPKNIVRDANMFIEDTRMEVLGQKRPVELPSKEIPKELSAEMQKLYESKKVA